MDRDPRFHLAERGESVGRPLSAKDVERQNADGMKRLLAAKERKAREQRPPRPTAQSDQRKYGKRGWTWTP